jgi:hypothetical protein
VKAPTDGEAPTLVGQYAITGPRRLSFAGNQIIRVGDRGRVELRDDQQTAAGADSERLARVLRYTSRVVDKDGTPSPVTTAPWMMSTASQHQGLVLR